MSKVENLIARVRTLSAEGRFSEADTALLVDVANGGNPGSERMVKFACDYFPAPVDLPKRRSRPGLLADDGDIESAREGMQSDPVNRSVWDMMEDNCRGIMDPDDERHVDYENRTQPHVWGKRQGHWVLSNAVEHLAWAYRFTGDKAYGEYARGILLAIASSRHGWGPVACNWGNPYKGWLTDNILDLGHATMPFAIGYDLVHDLMSDEDRKEIADYYEPYFHRLVGVRYEAVAQMPANTPIIGHCGVGLMGLSLADAYPEERRDVLNEAVRSAWAYAQAGMDGAVRSDGACLEGSGYCSASMHYIAVFAEGLRRVLGVNLFEHPSWRKNPIYLCCEMLPGGGAINNFNDNHLDGVTTGYWMIAAKQTGDDSGPWVWENFAGPKGTGELHRGDSTVGLPYVLLYRNPDVGNASPEELGVSKVHHFDAIHHLVARTGWDPQDLHVTFQCTPYDPDVHGHMQADRLNFTMYALGERFAIDSGYGLVPIKGSTQVKRMGKLGESHNQVWNDSKAQAPTPVQEGGDGYSRIVRWEQSGDWVWAVGEATPFYENASAVRRGIAIRLTAENPLIFIVDLVNPGQGSHTFDWVMQTEEENRFEIRETSIGLTGHRNGAKVNIVQAANLSVSWRQDEWISHPRLRGSGEGPFYVGLTAICTAEVLSSENGSEVSLKLEDTEGEVEVNVEWEKAGAPDSVTMNIADEVRFEV